MNTADISGALMLRQADQAATAKAGLFGAKFTSADKEAAAEKTAQDFESLFLSQMLEQMFGESLGDDFFGSSETDEVYKGLMVQEYGKKIAQAGGIGIASHIKTELLKLQEVPHE